MIGFLVSAIWWLLLAGAAFQTGRAWGLASGLGAFVVLVVLGHLGTLGVIASTMGALWIGYRAEQALEPLLLDTES